MSKAWEAMSSVERSHWRRYVRPLVLDRDGGMCQLRYEGEWDVRVPGEGGRWVAEKRRCAGVADQVHHTLGLHTGNDLRYLVAACGNCNRRAGDPSKGNPQPTIVREL